MTHQRTLSAAEAAAQLGVQLPTLYAYVSRGLIRSESGGSGERGRRYLVEDIAQMEARKRARRNPADTVRGALHWGAPVLDTRLTLISDGRLLYRGHNTVALARAATLERVAALLWLGDLDADACFGDDRYVVPAECQRALHRMQGLTPAQTMQASMPIAGAADVAAYDLRPESVVQAGARIVQLFTAIACGVDSFRGPIAAALQSRWAPDQPAVARLIDAALILCADHELNVSAFTARCVASAGATPYNVVTAGLAALQGTRHGGHTERVEALWREFDAKNMRTARSARQVLAGQLRRGEEIPGFGHALYPGGDPRAAELMRMLAKALPQAPAAAQAELLVREAERLIDQAPTIDFALVALARALNVADGALTLFALGRTIGWIAHAIEQYASNQLIRPRARYTGLMPA